MTQANPQDNPQNIWRKRIDEGASPMNGSQLWLVSFTDLFSILLCFFVMMYSMKDPDMDKISQVVGGRGGGGYAGTDAQEAGGDRKGANIKRERHTGGLDLSYLESILASGLQQAGLEQAVRIEAAYGYLALKPVSGDGAQIAQALGSQLQGLPNRVTVVGVPVGWSVGDWDGALANASAFAGHMQAGGYRRALAVSALGQNAQAQADAAIEIRVDAYSGGQ